MNLRRPLTALITLIATVATGCAAPDSGRGATITVYSSSGLSDWYRPQFEKFTAETGIGVTLFEAGSGELVSRVNSRAVWEGLDGAESVPPADLLITLPPFMQKAAKAGVLQSGGADTTGISPELVDPAGLFVPVALTALCFIANPSVTPMPATWDDLLRPELKGKLQYSTPGEAGDGTALLLLLQQLMGKRDALDFLAALQSNNVGPASSTAALGPKVARGELLVANGDLQMNLAAIKNDKSRFDIFFPAMPDGTRTSISLPYLAGVTTLTRRPDEARRLLALLLSDEAQWALHSEAAGIPVRESIARETAQDTDALSPAAFLTGVTMWAPDWYTVLTELDADLEAYRVAVG